MTRCRLWTRPATFPTAAYRLNDELAGSLTLNTRNLSYRTTGETEFPIR
jgi:hypothetical protein